MSRVLNAIDPQTAARIRAAINGKPQLKEAKAKRAQPVKAYVSQFHKFDPRNNSHTIQLPIAFRTGEYNAERTPWYLREKWVKEKREAVWLALMAYLPSFDGERVQRMEFVRIGLKKMDENDNLRAAFKSIVDATCSWAVWGREAPAHIQAIGKADDKLERRGVTWTYRQQKCESNPRLYGIRIVLHCTPLSPE
jgi:hypothetical protein